MKAAVQAPLANDTRNVIFHGESISLRPPGTHQKIDAEVIPPDSIITNELVLTATHNAKVWFDGISTLLVDDSQSQVFRYGGVSVDAFDKTDDRQVLEGSSLILGSAGAHCYYHWMVDVLPKLGVLEAAGIELNSIDHFILRDLDLPFQKTSLDILGIPLEKIVFSKDLPNIRAELVYNVEIRNFVGMKMNKFIPEYLKSIFMPFNIKDQSARKIYISRPKGVNRPVENEVEVLELLEGCGYQNVVMEGMSMHDQALLFANADSIITSHGGALTNIVYCQPGTKVIELFGAHVFSYYYGLANLCDLDYHAVLLNAEQYPLVVDPNKGNEMDNQQVTIRQASPVNLQALQEAIEARDV